ncbi:MAG: CBS domain-containing protein [Sphingomonadaceae bacterium]
MQIESCMESGVHAIPVNTTIQSVAQAMATFEIGCMPVVANEKLVGIVTDRDITLRGIARGHGPGAKTSEVMTIEVLYCRAHDEIDDVLDKMAQKQVRRLPVIDDNDCLIGVVSVADLTRASPVEGGESLVQITRRSHSHSQRLPSSSHAAPLGKQGIEAANDGGATSGRTAPRKAKPARPLISSKRVEGTPVFRPNGDRIGSVDHFMVDKLTGQVEYVVLSFGGFLGLGEELRPLPWQALEYSQTFDGYVVSADDDTFRNSPFVRGGSAPDYDSAYARSLYEFWGIPL